MDDILAYVMLCFVIHYCQFFFVDLFRQWISRSFYLFIALRQSPSVCGNGIITQVLIVPFSEIRVVINSYQPPSSHSFLFLLHMYNIFVG